jgi:hypothetical protein
VKKVDYTEKSVQVVFAADPELIQRLKKRVEELNGKFETDTNPQ